MRNNKKIGPGSLSLLFCIVGILFAVRIRNYGCFGDYILKHLRLNPWSHGNYGMHYTVFYSSIFYIVSIFLGYKYKGNFGAKTGKIVSVIMLIFILFLWLFSYKIT